MSVSMYIAGSVSPNPANAWVRQSMRYSRSPSVGAVHVTPGTVRVSWSVKGSGQGGSGAACRLSWRTAVVLPQDPGGDVMQLVLPATSCFGKEEGGKYPFRPYIQMLANNNISAGRVVTKMQFDTKSPVPKLLFSPIAVVPEADVEAVQRQRETKAAESAIKLTVYQQDEGESPEAPIVTGPAAMSEPIIRDAKKADDAAPAADVSDVIKKWSKKG